jgi:hypothetical protein
MVRIDLGQVRSRSGQDRSRSGQDRSRSGQDRSRSGQDRSRSGENRSRSGHERLDAVLVQLKEELELNLTCWETGTKNPRNFEILEIAEDMQGWLASIREIRRMVTSKVEFERFLKIGMHRWPHASFEVNDQSIHIIL